MSHHHFFPNVQVGGGQVRYWYKSIGCCDKVFSCKFLGATTKNTTLRCVDRKVLSRSICISCLLSVLLVSGFFFSVCIFSKLYTINFGIHLITEYCDHYLIRLQGSSHRFICNNYLIFFLLMIFLAFALEYSCCPRRVYV